MPSLKPVDSDKAIIYRILQSVVTLVVDVRCVYKIQLVQLCKNLWFNYD